MDGWLYVKDGWQKIDWQKTDGCDGWLCMNDGWQ